MHIGSRSMSAAARGASPKVPTKPYLLPHDTSLKPTPNINLSSKPDGEIVMNTIVANVLMREAAEAQADARPLKLIAFFCSVGLLASLCMASFGFDIGTGFF
jgi:hypothetical protein